MANIMQLLQTEMHPFTILPFFLLCFFIYKFLFSNHYSTQKHSLPPSPPKLPIIGNLHQIGLLPHRSLHNLSKQYGDLMLLHFGRSPVLVVSSSEAASQIMKTHDVILSDRPALSTFKRLLYDCRDVATAPYGDYWRRVRSVCVNQLLSLKRVQSFSRVREEEIGLMVKEIERSSTVNLSKMFSNLSSDVICRVAFGLKFHGEKDGIDFKDLLEKHEELLGRFNVGDFIPWLAWINHVNGVEKEINKCAKDMDKVLEDMVQEHIGKSSGKKHNNNNNNNNNDNDDQTQDFIDVLLELQQDHQTAEMRLDKESIKAIVLDMFAAGSTTTYATLEWAMSELLRNPTIMDSLKQEVRGITSGKTSITDNDLEKMVYLNAVIRETLRLHPPVPILLPRISSQGTKLNGFDIPTQTQVLVNVWAIQRDPTFWEDPLAFDPQRFLNSDIDYKGQNFNLIPFGSGRRGCPGALFATANLELALASLIHKFDWALPEGAQGMTLDDMEEYPVVTSHRKNPLFAVATPHSVV